jgi:hypothetical protein
VAKPADRRPRDPNQLGKLIVDIATGEIADTISPGKKDPRKTKGRAGGIKGGEGASQKT